MEKKKSNSRKSPIRKKRTKSVSADAPTNGASKKRGRPKKVSGVMSLDDLEMKLDALTGMKWRALDNEQRNHLQGIRIADLEIEQAKRALEQAQRTFQERVMKLQAQKEQLKTEYETQSAEYRELVSEIASKWNLDPKNISIDVNTFIVRDLREEQAKG